MEVIEIKDKDQWESFFNGISEKTFLNSWAWGEFNLSLGSKIWRLGVLDNKGLVALALVIRKNAKSGRHLFLPHAPSIIGEGMPYAQEILAAILNHCKKIAAKERAEFIRIGPIFPNTRQYKEIFRNLGFVNSPVFVHPEVSWVLDIDLPEEDLLKNMRKTTRYMIRQAQKNNVEVVKNSDIADIGIYNKIYLETVSRHDFIPFSEEYLVKELEAFKKGGNILTFFARHQGEYVSAAMIVFWQGAAFYHQGASLSRCNKTGASYLLQWEAIKEAKKRGCRLYNFWGIAPKITNESDLNDPKSKRHPWYGLSLFKMGFGGHRVEYLPTRDYPLSLKYWFTHFFERVRRKIRGL